MTAVKKQEHLCPYVNFRDVIEIESFCFLTTPLTFIFLFYFLTTHLQAYANKKILPSLRLGGGEPSLESAELHSRRRLADPRRAL